MTKEVTRYKVMHEDGKSYSVYYKKNGRCFVRYNIWDEKRGFFVQSPNYRITNKSFEASLPVGEEF